jgi:ribosome-associated toxin RatA of RatAB toxin-antitoxin module
MKHVKKSVLLWYSPHEMYELVIAVDDYPQFLPWCARAEVLERRADGLTARLHLAFRGLRHAFTTRNVHIPDRSVVLSLVDGPFSQLDGPGTSWRSQPSRVARPRPAESSSTWPMRFRARLSKP